MRLKQLRQDNHLTQKQLADGLGLTSTAIQYYERSRSKPSYDILIAMADYFHVSIDYLVGRTDSPDAGLSPAVPRTAIATPYSDEAISIAKIYDEVTPDVQRRINRYVAGEYDDWKRNSIEHLMEKAGNHC